MALDFKKLTLLRQNAVMSMYLDGAMSLKTTIRKGLVPDGWIQLTDYGWGLTDEGRAAVKQYFAGMSKPGTVQPSAPALVTPSEAPATSPQTEAPAQPAAASNPLREVRVYRDFSIRKGKAEYLAYRPGAEKWSLRAKTITELKELIDCLIESDDEAAPETTDPCAHIDPDTSPTTQWEHLKCQYEECQKQLAASQARERELRAALDVSPYSLVRMIGRLDEIHHLGLTDNQQFALGYLIGFLYRLNSLNTAASEEAK